MIEIKTETIINAPASDIWRKLINFNEYGMWNSFITKIIGVGVQGVAEQLTDLSHLKLDSSVLMVEY